jgi:arylsulfatase A-like enzyme
MSPSPRVLQKAGYRTALIGKWGLGDVGEAESGLPRKQGFDDFFGYLNQHHAHNHFPDYLWRNEAQRTAPNVIVPVGEDGAGYATEAKVYADDLFADEPQVRRENQGPALLPLLEHGHPARQQRARRSSATAPTCPTTAPMPTRIGRDPTRARPP